MMTSNAFVGLRLSATSTGSAAPMYVPTVGMNCPTRPTNNPIVAAYGRPIAAKNTPCATAETPASSSREYRYPAVFAIASSHTCRTRCWRLGGSTEHTPRRNCGPSAAK